MINHNHYGRSKSVYNVIDNNDNDIYTQPIYTNNNNMNGDHHHQQQQKEQKINNKLHATEV